MKRIVLLLVLCAGCQLLPALAAGASWLGSLLDVAEAGATAFDRRHPSVERSEKIAQGVLVARKALAALDAAIAAGEDPANARAEALQAYAELRAMLDAAGVLDARAPAGGAETEAPMPEPLPLPTPAEVEARL